jgi:hypothetical protein
MVESSGLLPIVMGIGLAAISGSTLAGARHRGDDSGWRDPLFVFAALLIGLSVLGAALYVLGWSIEKGRELPPVEARAENWLILTLALLLLAVAARSAWMGFFYSAESPPWERGHIDRLSQLFGFTMASLCVLLVGLLIDLVILLIAKLEPGPAILIIAATLVLGLASAWAILRLMSGGNPSPRAFSMSRKAQLKMLSALDGSAGHWQAIEVCVVGELEPHLSLRATIWMTARGMYWRVGDAFALARYHDWAANHLVTPTAAVHEQRLMLANPTIRADKHMEIKRWTGLRSRWRDTLRMNRVSRPMPIDSSSPERAAGLVHVPYGQLAAAGLRVTVCFEGRHGQVVAPPPRRPPAC